MSDYRDDVKALEAMSRFERVLGELRSDIRRFMDEEHADGFALFQSTLTEANAEIREEQKRLLLDLFESDRLDVSSKLVIP